MTAPAISPERLMVILGGSAVVLGGLVAAVSAPLTLDRGSWLAAYLVLVCGVAQYTIGTRQTRPGARQPSAAGSWTQLMCWNLGNVAVVSGTLTDTIRVLDAGAVLLLITVGIAMISWRHDASADAQPRGRSGRRGAAALVEWGYRGLVLCLGVSIPIGVVLAHLRSATGA